MQQKLIKTRKIDGEEYKFILELPSTNGEKGCLGLEIDPTIFVITPENSFGYTDIARFYKYKFTGVIGCSTQERYLQKWIKKELVKTYTSLAKKYHIKPSVIF